VSLHRGQDKKQLLTSYNSRLATSHAAQKGKVSSSRKYSKDLAFEENDYHYLDSYFGEKDFSGEEIVYFKELPIWSMNYYGKMIKENIPESFTKTLYLII